MNDRGTWYWMDSTGAMATGWIYDGSSRYYLDDKGNPTAQGWQNAGGSWYYFHDSGVMAIGWVMDGDSCYYMNETGAMVTGTQVIDGRRATFTASGRWTGYAS